MDKKNYLEIQRLKREMPSNSHSSIPTNAFFLFLGAVGVFIVGYFAGFDEYFFYLAAGFEALGILALILAIINWLSLDKDNRPPLKFPMRAIIITLVIITVVYFAANAFFKALGNAFSL